MWYLPEFYQDTETQIFLKYKTNTQSIVSINHRITIRFSQLIQQYGKKLFLTIRKQKYVKKKALKMEHLRTLREYQWCKYQHALPMLSQGFPWLGSGDKGHSRN